MRLASLFVAFLVTATSFSACRSRTYQRTQYFIRKTAFCPPASCHEEPQTT